MENKSLTRRDFIQQTGKVGLGLTLAATAVPAFLGSNSAEASPYQFTPIGYSQQPLPYSYKALEPIIDAQTMELHYSKHAAGYAKNLNEASKAEEVDQTKTSVEDILKNISKYSAKMRNNAGGHYNHELFWQCMSPNTDQKPDKVLLEAISNDFGSYEAFMTQFADAAKNRFGSGWAWLIVNDKKLKIGSTPNQDNPLMNVSELKGTPLLGLDVWEHAYYLHYQNKRADYIANWAKIINWRFVGDLYSAAIKK